MLKNILDKAKVAYISAFWKSLPIVLLFIIVLSAFLFVHSVIELLERDLSGVTVFGFVLAMAVVFLSYQEVKLNRKNKIK